MTFRTHHGEKAKHRATTCRQPCCRTRSGTRPTVPEDLEPGRPFHWNLTTVVVRIKLAHGCCGRPAVSNMLTDAPNCRRYGRRHIPPRLPGVRHDQDRLSRLRRILRRAQTFFPTAFGPMGSDVGSRSGSGNTDVASNFSPCPRATLGPPTPTGAPRALGRPGSRSREPRNCIGCSSSGHCLSSSCFFFFDDRLTFSVMHA